MFCDFFKYLLGIKVTKEKSKCLKKTRAEGREGFKSLLCFNSLVDDPLLVLSGCEGHWKENLRRKRDKSGLLNTELLNEDERNYVLNHLKEVPEEL